MYLRVVSITSLVLIGKDQTKTVVTLRQLRNSVLGSAECRHEATAGGREERLRRYHPNELN